MFLKEHKVPYLFVEGQIKISMYRSGNIWATKIPQLKITRGIYVIKQLQYIRN